MTPEEQKAFEDKIHAYVGREVCATTAAKDDVNPAMIRHWAEAMGDTNPAYQDADWAAASKRGHLIAPPAMMYCWGQEGIKAATDRSPDAQSDLVRLFDEYGFTGTLGTNVKQEYSKEVAVGDNIATTMVIDNVSEQKATARGIGYFFETLATFTNSAGEEVGTQRFRVLKFIPADQPAAAVDSGDKALEAPTRIASTAMGTSPWPVIMITGSALSVPISFFRNCMPPMPGILMSEITIPG